MSDTKKEIKWFGMKLSPKQKNKIRILAKRRGVSQKKAIMDLVDQAVEEEPIKAEPGSILERNRDLCGAGNSQMTNISANVDKYLGKWGYGR